MSTKIQMLHNLVLIQPPAKVTSTESGLAVIGEIDKTGPQKGTVLSVGPGIKDKHGNLTPIGVEPGDIVVYAKTDLREIKQGDLELVIVPATEILFKLVTA